MFTLRAEIAACLIAVAVLGLISGWMIQRARSSRQLDRVTRSWKKRYAELEASARQDEQNLEDRMESLVEELKTLKSENRGLREAARGREASSDGVRAEAIEQNRRQAETQERLQRIIRDREREIATLRASAEKRGERSNAPPVRGLPSPPPHAPDVATIEQLGRVEWSPDRPIVSEPLDETIRLDPAQLPDARASEAANERLTPGGVPMADGEPVFGDTAGEGPAADDHATGDRAVAGDSGADDAVAIARTAADPAFGDTAAGGLPGANADPRGEDDERLDESLDSTIEVAMLDAEEATIALDEEAMKLVREFGRGGQS